MRVRDIIYETLRSFASNKLRNLLTILGIVIGIGAVITMTALIGGIRQSLMGELGLSQARLVYISVYPGRDVTTDDVAAIARGVTDYEYVVPVTYAGAEISSDTKQSSASIEGVTAEYFDAMGVSFVAGHATTSADDAEMARVVVLDQNSVRTLYGNDASAKDTIGSTVKIGNDTYTIVGITESSNLYQSDYVQAFVPFSTTVSRISGTSNVDQILGFARESANMDTIAAHTKTFLTAYFGLSAENAEDSMYVTTMQSIIDEVNATMGAFQLLMMAVASIALLVGGIGIMNMMFTNVTERIREIGLRKALGARRRDITRQFLLESVCLCLVGGAFGMALGYGGSFLLVTIAGTLFSESLGVGPITPIIDIATVLTATGVCVAIGLIFGYFPARRAAKLNPVESLHYQ